MGQQPVDSIPFAPIHVYPHTAQIERAPLGRKFYGLGAVIFRFPQLISASATPGGKHDFAATWSRAQTTNRGI